MVGPTPVAVAHLSPLANDLPAGAPHVNPRDRRCGIVKTFSYGNLAVPNNQLYDVKMTLIRDFKISRVSTILLKLLMKVGEYIKIFAIFCEQQPYTANN